MIGKTGTLHLTKITRITPIIFPDQGSRRMVEIHADRPLRRRSPPAPDPQIMNPKILFKSV
jgi:hypothetical protein